MFQASRSRRGFLCSAAALAAGGACASLASTAQAITARPASNYGAVLGSACGPVGEHARLIEETEAAQRFGKPARHQRLLGGCRGRPASGDLSTPPPCAELPLSPFKNGFPLEGSGTLRQRATLERAGISAQMIPI